MSSLEHLSHGRNATSLSSSTHHIHNVSCQCIASYEIASNVVSPYDLHVRSTEKETMCICRSIHTTSENGVTSDVTIATKKTPNNTERDDENKEQDRVQKQERSERPEKWVDTTHSIVSIVDPTIQTWHKNDIPAYHPIVTLVSDIMTMSCALLLSPDTARSLLLALLVLVMLSN